LIFMPPIPLLLATPSSKEFFVRAHVLKRLDHDTCLGEQANQDEQRSHAHS
jgi:hypothetical protein